jgi:hypothetical protein
MPDTLKALFALLLDPLFATCLVVAVISALSLRRMKKSQTLTTGIKITLIILFALTALAVLFFSSMAVIFGPVPID